jgi:hypothetical protein
LRIERGFIAAVVFPDGLCGRDAVGELGFQRVQERGGEGASLECCVFGGMVHGVSPGGADLFWSLCLRCSFAMFALVASYERCAFSRCLSHFTPS